MQFIIETTSIAHWLPIIVPPPERGLGGATVGAAQPQSPGGGREHGGHGALEIHLKQ